MIRERNYIYHIKGEHDLHDGREDRNIGEKTPDFLEIKKTLRELYWKKQRIKYEDLTMEEIQEKISEIEEEEEFWKHELDFVQNPSHKKLKKKYSKLSKMEIREKTLELIEKGKVQYIHITDFARMLNVKEKDVFQVFADLNKEGVLSQAKHYLPHDTYRPGDSGWMDDIYEVRKKMEK